MKVAVISGEETQSGKSSLVLLLASVFARTQRKRVAIFSTGDLSPLLHMVELKDDISLNKSVGVYNALLKTASIRDEDLYDYSYRIGTEDVYGFNLFSATMIQSDIETLFTMTLDKVKADLSLIEVQGSLNNPFNKKVLESSDVILYVFNTSRRSIEGVKEYINTYDNQKVVLRTGYICQKFDRNVISDKQLSRELGISTSNILQIPYNSVIIKESLLGTLNTLARFIAEGHSEVLNLRIKLLEIMQYLFDSSTFKYIKGVSEWHK